MARSTELTRTSKKTDRIRSLTPGEPIPPAEPRRYLSAQGYMRLRWKVGVRQYVETYEHRVVDGFVTTAEHVHHKNRDRDDNRPENLEHLSAEDHYNEHHKAEHERAREMATLYEQGLSTTEVGRVFGINRGAVSKRVRGIGTTTRPFTSPKAEVPEAGLIAELYMGGRCLHSLGREFRIDAKRIRALVIEGGGRIRRPGRPKPHAVAAENVTRTMLRSRCGGWCEVCGAVQATELQHRKAKVHGGPWAIWNALAVCGRGNYAGCHGRIHQHPAEAYENGWSVRSGHDPATTPVLIHGVGRVLLGADGTYIPYLALPTSERTA